MGLGSKSLCGNLLPILKVGVQNELLVLAQIKNYIRQHVKQKILFKKWASIGWLDTLLVKNLFFVPTKHGFVKASARVISC